MSTEANGEQWLREEVQAVDDAVVQALLLFHRAIHDIQERGTTTFDEAYQYVPEEILRDNWNAISQILHAHTPPLDHTFSGDTPNGIKEVGT